MKIATVSLIAAFFATLVIAPSLAQVTTVSAPYVMDTALGPGTSLTIDVGVADVEDLCGYQFLLTFDPAILTAVSFASYEPFVVGFPSEIGPGYVSVAYSMPFGTTEGFTGSTPLASIDFTVNDYGSTFLDLQDTVLMDPDGIPIAHDIVDGFFANIETRFHVEMQRVQPEHKKWVESIDRYQTMTARIKNLGSVATDVEVTFTFADEGGMWTYSEVVPARLEKKNEKLDVTLEISRGWLITKGAPFPYYGTYYVTITLMYHDLDLGAWLPGGRRAVTSFTFSA
jgi:hypothetical protein